MLRGSHKAGRLDHGPTGTVRTLTLRSRCLCPSSQRVLRERLCAGQGPDRGGHGARAAAAGQRDGGGALRDGAGGAKPPWPSPPTLPRSRSPFLSLRPGRWLQAALFFHSNLLHSSSANKSDRSRWSLICCYGAVGNEPHFPAYGLPTPDTEGLSAAEAEMGPIEVWDAEQRARVMAAHRQRLGQQAAL